LAGLALLPWEKWIEAVINAIRRKVYRQRWNRDLAISATWHQAEGTVYQVNSDASNQREELVYYYSTPSGQHSGFFWHWFDSSDEPNTSAGGIINLRYDPDDPDQSVVVSFPIVIR
jgi:hypothetical protein